MRYTKVFGLVMLLSIFAMVGCKKTANPDLIEGKGTIEFLDNSETYRILVADENYYVQAVTRLNEHCPMYTDFFVEEGMVVEFAAYDLDYEIPATSTLPSAKAITFSYIVEEGGEIPAHVH